MMKVCLVSKKPGGREDLISFLREYLRTNRGWQDVGVERTTYDEFALDQYKDPVAIVLLEFSYQERKGQRSAEDVLRLVREARGDKPHLVCIYPARSHELAEDLEGIAGTEAVLHQTDEKLRDRKVVLAFFRQHLDAIAHAEVEEVNC